MDRQFEFDVLLVACCYHEGSAVRPSEPFNIRKVTTDGIINTIAGTQDGGYSGDGGPATQAQLGNPTSLTVDAAGNVYFADSFYHVIRVLRPVR